MPCLVVYMEIKLNIPKLLSLCLKKGKKEKFPVLINYNYYKSQKI